MCTNPVVEWLSRVHGEAVFPAVCGVVLAVASVRLCGRPGDPRELGQESVSRRGAGLLDSLLLPVLLLVTQTAVHSPPSSLQQAQAMAMFK
jgi:hypothetical protein